MATSQIPNGYTPEEGAAFSRAGSNASRPQLICALDVIISLLRSKNIPFAVMGGLALNFRGSERETHDVDLTAACDMRTLREACTGAPRIKLPIGPVSGVMRVFVHVGPSFQDLVEDKWVQADIILRGSLGAPDDLNGSTELLPVIIEGAPREYVVLNVAAHLQSKLGAFFARGGRSDYEDIVFMCSKYFQQIAGFRSQLSKPHREYFIRHYMRENSGPAGADKIKKIKMLLGVA